ncbi:diiron oxygenase [Lentzea sp. BCCO 10_0798]|uniref:Diiron oxygenase n=1 Tax=Lentzea kristufekii TaxID=3095430 RepID=A0ABU4U118_9PSEU|nr:diiron oxygenase [Lentzea sp. BCCO 10_0798]MDX8053969.1 diiron oxygenase [Lentzea sp. BCCO 10_0798]
MCGIAGLFIGCPALAACPKKALAALAAATTAPDDGTVPEDVPEYRSPFATWFERSSVRQAPRRVLEDGEDKHAFSPDLVPLARHALVRALPGDVFGEVLTQHLYRYLDFTTKLEHLVVNRTVLGIAHRTVGVELPEEMVFDAYKIYCDEAYHAVFSADLLRQVRARTGIAPKLVAEPYFTTRLRQIQDSLAPELRPLAELLFVVCSETLISATLAEVPEDPRVHAAVRDTIRDHAQDEGRHHAYFASFLKYLWAQLDPAVRRELGPLLPDLVLAFLHPDLPAVREELLGYGLSRDDAEQVLAEVYDEHTVREYARDTARLTLRHFASVGVLDDPAARDRFEELGLLEGALLR